MQKERKIILEVTVTYNDISRPEEVDRDFRRMLLFVILHHGIMYYYIVDSMD